MPAPLPFSRPPRRRPPAGTCRVCGCTDALACIEPGFGTCGWVDESLCSRCHGPKRPTLRQAAELDRIRSRQGPFRLDYGVVTGELVLTLDAQGRVVRRLERRVTERREAA